MQEKALDQLIFVETGLGPRTCLKDLLCKTRGQLTPGCTDLNLLPCLGGNPTSRTSPYTPRAPATPGEPRAHAPKVYRSSEEIWSKIAPPGCVLGLSHVDHRFSCRYAVDHEVLCSTFQISISRCTSGHPPVLLGDVEADQGRPPSLPEGMEKHVPGCVPAKVLEALKPIIDKLPSVKKYQQQALGLISICLLAYLNLPLTHKHASSELNT